MAQVDLQCGPFRVVVADVGRGRRRARARAGRTGRGLGEVRLMSSSRFRRCMNRTSVLRLGLRSWRPPARRLLLHQRLRIRPERRAARHRGRIGRQRLRRITRIRRRFADRVLHPDRPGLPGEVRPYGHLQLRRQLHPGHPDHPGRAGRRLRGGQRGDHEDGHGHRRRGRPRQLRLQHPADRRSGRESGPDHRLGGLRRRGQAIAICAPQVPCGAAAAKVFEAAQHHPEAGHARAGRQGRSAEGRRQRGGRRPWSTRPT